LNCQNIFKFETWHFTSYSGVWANIKDLCWKGKFFLYDITSKKNTFLFRKLDALLLSVGREDFAFSNNFLVLDLKFVNEDHL